MNRILIFKHEWDQKQTVVIKGDERFTHLQNVIRPRIGDRLKLCLVDCGLAAGCVESFDEQSLTLKILQQEQGQSTNWHLEVGLSRPLTCKKLLEAGTSLGVASFSFFHTRLSQKSYATSKLFREGGATRAIGHGLSVSGVYYRMPAWKLHPAGDFPNSSHAQKYFLSLRAQETFAQVGVNFDNPLVVAVGPERDWTGEEEDRLVQNGYRPVSLGPSILKVETAACVALGQLQLLKSVKN